MRWLTLEMIKAQLRIEPENTSEDTLLAMYGESAEDFILQWTQRTEAELKAMNSVDPTKVPTSIIHASLMIVDTSYQYRNPVSIHITYLVPYTFDVLVAPYRKGTYSSVDEEED